MNESSYAIFGFVFIITVCLNPPLVSLNMKYVPPMPINRLSFHMFCQSSLSPLLRLFTFYLVFCFTDLLNNILSSSIPFSSLSPSFYNLLHYCTLPSYLYSTNIKFHATEPHKTPIFLHLLYKVKGKFHPIIFHEGTGVTDIALLLL